MSLKREFVDLFDEFEHIGDGELSCIEVHDGLPFRMSIEIVGRTTQ